MRSDILPVYQGITTAVLTLGVPEPWVKTEKYFVANIAKIGNTEYTYERTF